MHRRYSITHTSAESKAPLQKSVKSIDPCTWHIILRRTHELFTGYDLDAIWRMDLDWYRSLFHVFYASQQIKELRHYSGNKKTSHLTGFFI